MSKAVFDQLRTLSGGALSQEQVDAGNRILGFANESVVLQFLGANNVQKMKVSQYGTNLIKQFESLRLSAYDDGVGVWTIAYGTTKYPNGLKVKRGDKCTQQEAEQYLQHDLAEFVEAVNDALTTTVNQNQFDAMVSLAYNIGITAFKGSTLVKKVNTGDKLAAANQFLLWNKAGGRVLQGLVNRRSKERALFLS